MKWLILLLTPLFLIASPEQELYRIFDIPTTLSQKESLDAVQKLWLQQGKERWLFQDRYEELRPQVWPLFEELGMVDDIRPLKKHYQTVLVFGALHSTVQNRVDYLISTGITFGELVFLSGDRPLTEAEKEKTLAIKTESEMVRWVYDQSNLPKNLPVLFIEVPMKGERRPNTLDTIVAWLQTDPHPESCLAISSQPYVHYQQAVLNRLLPFSVETIGYKISGHRSVAIMLDTLAREMTYKYGEIEWLQM